MSDKTEVAHRFSGGGLLVVGVFLIAVGIDAPDVNTSGVPDWFDAGVQAGLLVAGLFVAIFGLGRMIHRRPPR